MCPCGASRTDAPELDGAERETSPRRCEPCPRAGGHAGVASETRTVSEAGARLPLADSLRGNDSCVLEREREKFWKTSLQDKGAEAPTGRDEQGNRNAVPDDGGRDGRAPPLPADKAPCPPARPAPGSRLCASEPQGRETRADGRGQSTAGGPSRPRAASLHRHGPSVSLSVRDTRRPHPESYRSVVKEPLPGHTS